jgi:hypothetical protein
MPINSQKLSWSKHQLGNATSSGKKYLALLIWRTSAVLKVSFLERLVQDKYETEE